MQVAVRGGHLLVFATYHRHGLDPALWAAVAAYTRGGQLLFAMFGDFN